MDRKTFINTLTKYRSIAIIGMAKNVGKTTLLNFIQHEAKGKCTLGLTSIGRDGEKSDLITGTKKPEIYVYRGTYIATAYSLIGLSDVTPEIVETTGIMTPMGEIIILKANSDGYIQLAGPSVNSQLHALCQRLISYGCETVICDGALSRKTSASPSVTEAAILSTGASVGEDMDRVIEETCHMISLLSIEEVTEGVRIGIRQQKDRKVMLIDQKGSVTTIPIATALGSMVEIMKHIHGEVAYLYIGGVVTDSMMGKLLASGNKITLVVEDGTKLLISHRMYSRCLAKGISVLALVKINLIGISINPVSPYGYNYDPNRFYQKLSSKISLPVMDVGMEL